MYKYGIVVIAYKNEDRIKRLLNALSIADYDNNDDVYLITPLYNFTNDTLVSESTVLRHLLRHLILYQFRLFP